MGIESTTIALTVPRLWLYRAVIVTTASCLNSLRYIQKMRKFKRICEGFPLGHINRILVRHKNIKIKFYFRTFLSYCQAMKKCMQLTGPYHIYCSLLSFKHRDSPKNGSLHRYSWIIYHFILPEGYLNKNFLGLFSNIGRNCGTVGELVTRNGFGFDFFLDVMFVHTSKKYLKWMNEMKWKFIVRKYKFNILNILLISGVIINNTQYAISPEFNGKQETEVFQWERSILTLGSQIPSIYSATCGIQRKAKKNQY